MRDMKNLIIDINKVFGGIAAKIRDQILVYSISFALIVLSVIYFNPKQTKLVYFIIIIYFLGLLTMFALKIIHLKIRSNLSAGKEVSVRTIIGKKIFHVNRQT